MGWSGDSKQVTEALPKCDSVSPDRKTLRQGVDLRPRVRVAGNTHNLKAPSRSLTRPDFRRAPRRRYSPRPSHDIAVNTGLPMVALKLTQKHFGRPVSRLNFQEPLRQEESPKTWDPCRRQVKSLDSVHEIVLHQEDKLEFLDFYNEKSNREPILRSMSLQKLNLVD